jgi:hypothetical protein
LVEYVEQPCHSIEELAAVRRHVTVPIAADEFIRRAEDPLRVVVAGAADVAVMLALARKRVADEGLHRVELQHGDAQALDLPAGIVDTVVSTVTFCTIPDPPPATSTAYSGPVAGSSWPNTDLQPSRSLRVGSLPDGYAS